MDQSKRPSFAYWLLVTLCWGLGVGLSLTPFGSQLDNNAFDHLYRLHPPTPWTPSSALLAIDEATLREIRGIRGIRRALAETLPAVARASPAAVVVDITLVDEGDGSEDAELEAALAQVPGLVLACEMRSDGSGWQDPLPAFRARAAAVGHDHAEPDYLDAVSRSLPLMKVAGKDRRWALSVEAFRIFRGAEAIVETPGDLEVGGVRIEAPAREGRLMRIRYLPDHPDGTPAIPRIPLADVLAHPERAESFRGKVVFVGVTDQSAARDRLHTPLSRAAPMPGVEIHAQAFETMAAGRFFRSTSAGWLLLVTVLLAFASGLVFRSLSGSRAYACAAAVLLAAHSLPHLLFLNGVVFPYFPPVLTAWLSLTSAATYQHFAVRRRLARTETEKERYQQAIRFVTHEMRTPLTAIQGSSELMTQYALTPDKQRQLAQMIHSESRRLANMITTFLNVEKLTAGQMELKKQSFSAAELMRTCAGRTRPLAERKRIRLAEGDMDECLLVGDQELMEYAVYNLITNAVKYSPEETVVKLSVRRQGPEVLLSVKDQGMGMDEQEVRQIFRKFYRTKRAEASGESGAGIGLSIVEQIVTAHGGRVEVVSALGKGSCFTIVIPAEGGLPSSVSRKKRGLFASHSRS